VVESTKPEAQPDVDAAEGVAGARGVPDSVDGHRQALRRRLGRRPDLLREWVRLRSPVRENRTPGSMQGALGNRRPYCDGTGSVVRSTKSLAKLGT
jgi:hypothetical protein